MRARNEEDQEYEIGVMLLMRHCPFLSRGLLQEEGEEEPRGGGCDVEPVQFLVRGYCIRKE